MPLPFTFNITFPQLDRIENQLATLTEALAHLQTSVDALQATEAKVITGIEGLKTLIQSQSEQIAALQTAASNGEAPAALQAIIDEIESTNTDLQSAVANLPSAPTPVTPVPPVTDPVPTPPAPPSPGDTGNPAPTPVEPVPPTDSPVTGV